MEARTVKLHDGSVLELAFDMDVWEQLEDEIDVTEKIGQRLTEKGRIKLLPRIAAVMARPREDGSRWKAEEIRARLTPRIYGVLNAAVNLAIADAMKMETEQPNESAVVDETLEELEKNGPKAD